VRSDAHCGSLTTVWFRRTFKGRLRRPFVRFPLRVPPPAPSRFPLAPSSPLPPCRVPDGNLNSAPPAGPLYV